MLSISNHKNLKEISHWDHFCSQLDIAIFTTQGSEREISLPTEESLRSLNLLWEFIKSHNQFLILIFSVSQITQRRRMQTPFNK